MFKPAIFVCNSINAVCCNYGKRRDRQNGVDNVFLGRIFNFYVQFFIY